MLLKPELHFYWLAIEGLQPNIPENIIEDEEEEKKNEKNEQTSSIRKESKAVESKHTERRENITQEMLEFVSEFQEKLMKEVQLIKDIKLSSFSQISKEFLRSILISSCYDHKEWGYSKK